VFTSSVGMFVYIKTAIQRCTKLTIGLPFFALSKEFKACLQKYSKVLRNKLPLPTQGPSGTMIRLPDGGEVDVCYVVNTAEYCTDTIPQLEEMIKAKIDLSYAETVNLTGEVDAFHEVITQAIKVLVGALEARFSEGFRSMQTFNWATCEGVGEESAYVRIINDAIKAYVPPLRSLLSAVYFRNFCDKFAQSFLPSYLQMIIRLKRINEMGTQQLLLDVYNLKTLMLNLPTMGQPPGETTPVPGTYIKYVAKQVAKIEVVLKLVSTPVDMLAETFKIMWQDGESQGESDAPAAFDAWQRCPCDLTPSYPPGCRTADIQCIMSLKGMSKKEQQRVMEAVGLEFTGAGAPEPEKPADKPNQPARTGTLPTVAPSLPIPLPSMPSASSVTSGAASVTRNLESQLKGVAEMGRRAFR
jgi:hypothetical protein